MYVDENKAVELLNAHEIVALPTETVYGLAARFDSETALKKVFQIKKRPSFDPLIVHISHESQLSQLVADVLPSEAFLMEEFWPGPMTLVMPKKSTVSEIITSGLSTIAVRMPKNQSFHDIIQRTAPLAAPSANLFGHTSPTAASHVEFEFDGKLPVFDGGPCAVGIESTVLRVAEEDQALHLHILRPGMLSPQEMSTALHGYTDKKIIVHYGASTASPGHVQDHYQPRVPLVVARTETAWDASIHEHVCQRLHIAPATACAHLTYAGQDPALVARTLYSDLRRLSSENVSYIYLTVNDSFFSEDWRGIQDRITKASTLNVQKNSSGIVLENKLDTFH